MSTPMPGAGSPLEDANTAGALLLPGSDVTTPDAAVPVGRRRAGGFADVARRYRRNRLAVVGLVIVVVLAVVALFEPWLTPYDPLEQNLGNTLRPPSADHWFGTDVLGRDLYSGIIYGTRLAMRRRRGSRCCARCVIGVVLGALAGVQGGAWDAVIGRVDRRLPGLPAAASARSCIVQARRRRDRCRWSSRWSPRLDDHRPADARPGARAARGRVRRGGAVDRRLGDAGSWSGTSCPTRSRRSLVVRVHQHRGGRGRHGVAVVPRRRRAGRLPEWGRLIRQASPFLRYRGNDAPVAGARGGDRRHDAGVRVRRRRAAATRSIRAARAARPLDPSARLDTRRRASVAATCCSRSATCGVHFATDDGVVKAVAA